MSFSGHNVHKRVCKLDNSDHDKIDGGIAICDNDSIFQSIITKSQ